MVKFSPLGTHFAVLFPKKIEIYSLTLKLLYTMTTKSRFNTLLFSLLPASQTEEEEREVLCVGTEKGKVEVYSVDVLPQEDRDDEEVAEIEEANKGAKLDLIGELTGHTNR